MQSASRPKTAGRNSERPPSSSSFTRQIAQRTSSRSGYPNAEPEWNSDYNRSLYSTELSSTRRSVTSKAGISSTMRLGSASTRIATAAPGAISTIPPPGTGQHRPVTQQGVSGVRATTGNRMGSVYGNRQVADKTYFIGLLNNQLKLLQDEISSLMKEWEKTEKGRRNLLTAEAQADELKQLQTELSNLNLIIDRQNTNTDLRDLEFELIKIEKANQELSDIVEELFRERREKEEIGREIEHKIEEMRQRNAQKINNLDFNKKEEIQLLKTKADELQHALEEEQHELDELNKVKEDLDLALANSPLKQQAMVLEEQIQELENKKKTILQELNSEGSPEEQRQKLIERIQKDNEEISHMQTQIEELNERIAVGQEEIREFTYEYEMSASDKSDRFRELRSRDAYIDAFLDTFDESKAEVNRQITKLSAKVVNLLHLISANCYHIQLSANISAIDESVFHLNGFKAADALSVSELQDLHVRLENELISLQRTEDRLVSDFHAMQKRQQEISTSDFNIDDLERSKTESEIKKEELNNRLKLLNDNLSQRDIENSEIVHRIGEMERSLSLNTNQMYNKLRELKRRVDLATEEQNLLREKVDRQVAKNDFELIKHEALKLREEYNNLLIGMST